MWDKKWNDFLLTSPQKLSRKFGNRKASPQYEFSYDDEDGFY